MRIHKMACNAMFIDAFLELAMIGAQPMVCDRVHSHGAVRRAKQRNYTAPHRIASASGSFPAACAHINSTVN